MEGGGGEGGEGVKVKVWAVKAMSEAVVKCSDSQLAQSCQRWRASLASALQVEKVLSTSLCEHPLSPSPPPPSSLAAVLRLLVRSALQ